MQPTPIRSLKPSKTLNQACAYQRIQSPKHRPPRRRRQLRQRIHPRPRQIIISKIRQCGQHQLVSRIHKRGVLSGYTADEAVGITVNSLMFRKRLTRVELGRALGVTPAAAGRKLRGEIGWSIGDLFHVAEFLGVEVSTLLPARGRKIPANPEADGELVAGTGFEPVTSGL